MVRYIVSIRHFLTLCSVNKNWRPRAHPVGVWYLHRSASGPDRTLEKSERKDRLRQQMSTQ